MIYFSRSLYLFISYNFNLKRTVCEQRENHRNISSCYSELLIINVSEIDKVQRPTRDT